MQASILKKKKLEVQLRKLKLAKKKKRIEKKEKEIKWFFDTIIM